LPDLLVALAECEHRQDFSHSCGARYTDPGAVRRRGAEGGGGPMGDDTASRIGWGVVLGGHAFDLELWREAFKQPFDPLDPWVMETKFGPILRSSQLDGAATASAAYERAKALMDEVNGAMRASRRTETVRLEGIVEILSDETVRRQLFEQTGEVLRLKGRAVGGIGLDGAPEPPKPDEPSEPQQWLSIAAEDDLLADALTYFARGDDWFDVYKALECLEMRFGGARKGQVERFRGLGWADPDKIKLLKQTANSGRHARKKFDPPPDPMEWTEARDLLAKLMARAFHEASAAPTPSPERSKGGRKAQRKARAASQQQPSEGSSGPR